MPPAPQPHRLERPDPPLRRGPRRHPAHVYWRRRVAFVVVPALLIVAIGWMFTDRNFGGRSANDRLASPGPSAGTAASARRSANPSGAAIPKVDVTNPAAGRARSGITGAAPGFSAPSWPARGQAALLIQGRGSLGTSGVQRPVPIASLAKVMTAYVVLLHHPDASHGPTLVVDAALVRDTARRRALDQSVVSVRAGERLTEAQALEAVLLPSANNIAVALARREAGSGAAFVREMNTTAAALGMTHTRYTDPSGYAVDTVSTATDQLLLLSAAMRIPAFVRLAGLRQATIPVAGRIINTNQLIGHDGFLLGKTGSDTAAGGCLAFARSTRGRSGPVIMLGVVLGQRGGPLVAAGQREAKRLVDSVRPT